MIWPRRRLEVGAAVAFLVIVTLVFTSKYGTLSSQWVFGHRFREPGTKDAHPYIKPSPLSWHTPIPTPTRFNNASIPLPTPRWNRIIVLTKLESEDASWLAKDFPNWQHEIRVVDKGFSNLHPSGSKIDKGRVANAYLTYLIENYHNLPWTIVFLNTQQNKGAFGGHGTPSYDRVRALRSLNIHQIQLSGYANLRCTTKAGCQDQFLPMRDPPDEFRTLEVAMPKAWKDMFKNDNVPEKLATPCCAEFVVSAKQVKKRGVEEYLRYWEWLNKTTMDDETAGLVFEYLWHVIFGRDPEYCPELKSCECDLYGRCG